MAGVRTGGGVTCCHLGGACHDGRRAPADLLRFGTEAQHQRGLAAGAEVTKA